MTLLKVNNLSVNIEEKNIINGLNLNINSGEIHALMGPNGCGKSTLAQTLAGNPNYTVTSGQVSFNSKNLIDQKPEERVHHGLMLVWQNPITLPGIKVSHFLRLAVNTVRQANNEKPYTVAEFLRLLRQTMSELKMKPTLATRSVNEGLSGGEKKKLEILTALLIKPKLLILDELDSGLDLDAIKIVATQVEKLAKQGCAILIITHYHRLLDYLKPDQVHIISEGRLAKSGTANLAKQLEESSYEAIVNHK